MYSHTTEVTRGPPELVQHFRLKGEFTSAQDWYGLAVSLAYPSGEEGGSFLVQMISTCLPSRRGRGRRGRHPVVLARKIVWFLQYLHTQFVEDICGFISWEQNIICLQQ